MARVLAARHLIEAVGLVADRSRVALLAAASVDMTHALSMALLAAVRPRERRPAVASMLASGGLAAVAVARAR